MKRINSNFNYCENLTTKKYIKYGQHLQIKLKKNYNNKSVYILNKTLHMNWNLMTNQTKKAIWYNRTYNIVTLFTKFIKITDRKYE